MMIVHGQIRTVPLFLHPSLYQRFGWFASPAVDAALRMIIRPPFWLLLWWLWDSMPELPPTAPTVDVGVDDTAGEEEEDDDEANICRRSWEWT